MYDVILAVCSKKVQRLHFFLDKTYEELRFSVVVLCFFLLNKLLPL